MKAITVYRLEHPETGRGPYWHAPDNKNLERLMECVDAAHSGSWRHPTPGDDFDLHPSNTDVLSKKKSPLYGCTSEQLLKQWFGWYYGRLLKNGFVLKTYVTKKYVVSKSERQVAFIPA